jgi:putative ABC transport system permease protein
MPLPVKARSFVRNLLWSRQVEADLDQEVRSHLEMLTEENLRAGLPLLEAQRTARIELGGIDQLKERVHDAQIGNWLQSVLCDCRFALRQCRRSPAFSIAAILTLALGIGATTAIFSFADFLLDHPVSLRGLSRLVSVDEIRNDGEERALPPGNFRDLRAEMGSLQSFAGYQEWTAALLVTKGAEECNGVRVSEDFFATLATEPYLGRFFLPDEYRRGKNGVAILSYGFWQRQFAADPRVIDKTLKFAEGSYVIVGVMPASFKFPPGEVQFWVPLAVDDALASNRAEGLLATVGRLKPGTTLEQSRAELNVLWTHLQQQSPEANRQWKLSVLSLRGRLVDEDSRQFALLFLCVAGFVLLIACVNVANLQLARAASREQELSIRAAIGAGRARIVRQFLTESLLLAVLGGAAGLLFALWGVALMRANMPAQVREISDVSGMRMDVRAFLFTALSAAIAGLLSGATPAFRGARVNLRDSLERGGTRIVSGGQRLRGAFVISEVTLAVVLLIGAGLMAKGFRQLANHHVAMHPDTLLTFHLNLSPNRYASRQQRQSFYYDLLDRLREVPAVEAVSAVSGLPYSFYENDLKARSDASPAAALSDLPTVMQESTSDDYFGVLRLPLLEGRFFDPRDGAEAPPVAIVSESLARRLWPGVSAVGHRLGLPDSNSPDKWITVVGVVADIRHEVYDRSFRSILYEPISQVPGASMDFALRTSVDPDRLIRTVRSAIADLDPAQPVTALQSMTKKINQQASALQFVATLMGLFGLIAIVLSTAGIHGLIAYSVAERRCEIGVRMALGARPIQVLAAVFRAASTLVGIGGSIGLVLGFILAQLLSGMLYGVRAWDPTIYANVPCLLVFVTLLATCMPALKAARIDPMVALRYE